MARIGISYEQVAEIADSIVAQGKLPGVRNIRERLTTGSPNTIQKHLDTWREARPKATVKAIELPVTLTTAIASELEKAAASARSEIENRLVQAQDDADELAAAGEQLEEERDDLLNQLSIVITERDQATATAAERAIEIERMTAELARERHAAEQARIEVAQGRNKQETSDEKIKEQKVELEQLRKTLEQLQTAKYMAEQAAAVANAKLEAMTDRTARAEARIELLEKQQDTNTKELNSALNQITCQQIALDASSREADILKNQIKEAKADAKKAVGEVSSLTSQVALLTAQLKEAKADAKKTNQ